MQLQHLIPHQADNNIITTTTNNNDYIAANIK